MAWATCECGGPDCGEPQLDTVAQFLVEEAAHLMRTTQEAHATATRTTEPGSSASSLSPHEELGLRHQAMMGGRG